MTAAIRVARRTSTANLKRIRTSVEKNLHEALSSGASPTQAYAGMLEILEACTEELQHRVSL